ncbi:NACHT domain-containing protein [Mycena latifolia]|nr:NACHT domain-containing protein [Mycena latifolia]
MAGTFITAQNVNHRHGETGINILHRAVALEALYDSAESFPQPNAIRVPRTDMLDRLYSWATEEHVAYPIYWLHGPAGAGKSAIMQTLCRRLQDGGRFSGSFFFKRSHTTRGNAKALFVTLAYQLALHHPELKGPISESIEGDPSTVGREMDIQLAKLIIGPCAALTNSPSIMLLIDGLDECNGNDVQQEVLRLLGSVVSKIPMLRILIASRPEPQISQVFKEPGMTGLYHLLDIRPSFMDIRNYLLSEFDRIHHEHEETMASVPTPWPTWDILQVLVDKSSGYFIYVATIIKFIDDRDFRPTERLAAVIENLPTECGTPFHALDKLYSQILCDVPSQSRMLDILCVIVHGSMLRRSTRDIEKLLGLNLGDVKLTLRRLQSLLLVPQDETDIISLHHKSFPDFLIDPNRSGKFHLQRKDMARLFLQALSHSPNNGPLRSTLLAWEIGMIGLRYITSEIPPSADLLPLIQTINFDFFWRNLSGLHTHAKKMICWLKVSPEASIHATNLFEPRNVLPHLRA